MKDSIMFKKIFLTLFIILFSALTTLSAEKPRWVAQPVYVYIPNYGNISKYMQQAFLEWENKSNELIKFKFVNKPSNANIQVNFVDHVTNCNSPLAVGCARMSMRGGQYYSCQLDIAMQKKYGDGYRPIKNIYGVMLHEIGHAIGLDHSQSPNSIMYPYDLPTLQYLTKEDINLIYKKYH